RQVTGIAPRIPRLVEIQMHAVAAEVDDVGRTAAGDVCEPDATRIELIGSVEPRRIAHRNLGPEPAVSEVWPVTDLAVADTNDVREPVARHVREVCRLCALCEQNARPHLFIERLLHPDRGAETVLAERRIPD